MQKTRIHNIFKKYRALSWAARVIQRTHPTVDKGTLSRWLSGIKNSRLLEENRQRLEWLADQVQRTKGRCKKEPEATVRERIDDLRGKNGTKTE